MNKFQSAKNKIMSKAVILGGSVSALAIGLFASVAKADTAADIASTTQSVGTTLQTNFVSVLTGILPYVLGVVAIFVGVRLGMNWMKRAAK